MNAGGCETEGATGPRLPHGPLLPAPGNRSRGREPPAGERLATAG